MVPLSWNNCGVGGYHIYWQYEWNNIFSRTKHILDDCFLLNLFIISLYLCLFNLIQWCYMPVGCTCNDGTGLWSMGNCITSSWFLRITLSLPLLLFYCIACHLMTLVCCWLLFSVSPLCMIHLRISTCLNSSPMACPPSSVLSNLFSCRPIWFNICFCNICCSTEMWWDYFLYVCNGPPSFAILDFGLLYLLF